MKRCIQQDIEWQVKSQEQLEQLRFHLKYTQNIQDGSYLSFYKEHSIAFLPALLTMKPAN